MFKLKAKLYQDCPLLDYLFIVNSGGGHLMQSPFLTTRRLS